MSRINRGPQLTQRLLDTVAPPPKGGRYIELRDHEVGGLCVRISWTGRKSWSYEFRSPITKRNARVTLGTLSLAEARKAAMAKKNAVIVERRDPAIEKTEALAKRRYEYAGKITVAGALDLYEPQFLAKRPHKAESRRNRIRKLRNALEPFIKHPVAALTKGELMARLDEIKVKQGPVACLAAHTEIRAWLGWLHDRESVPTNVLDRIRKEAPNVARQRVLSDVELAAMMAATNDGSAFSDIVRVLLHTAMRRGEASSLQVRDLDFGLRTITVRPEISKTGHVRVIPMPAAIMSALRVRATGIEHREGFIFGDASVFKAPFSGWGKRVAALAKAMPEGERWTLHDIRRTVATRLHEAGTDPLVIEDLLGHLSGVRRGVAGVYNRAETIERQRAAIDQWAIRLEKIGATIIRFVRG